MISAFSMRVISPISSILTLVPMIVVVSLFSAYGISPRMKAAILSIFFKHMLPQTAESAAHYIDSFVSNS